MTPKAQHTSLDQFQTLIICRGPIAMEAMEVAHEMGLAKPDIAVSKREVYESAAGRAPWSEYTHLYRRLHIVDDYKDQDSVISIAKANGIHAIYVGYGYNAENAEFVGKCERAGIIPIAPPSSVMAFSGSKFRAKRRVRDELGIRVLPGSDAAAELAQKGEASDEELIESVVPEVEKVLKVAPGGIVRLKAAKSGGGKGQRLVTEVSQAASAVKEIWAEISARGVDGDKGVLVEANLAHPRHWEIQVFSDGETVVHFAGRECSIQNSGSQKFIEVSLHPRQYESYIASLDPKSDAKLISLLREEEARIEETCNHAVEIIRSLGYRGAATVEFLVAEDGGPEIYGKPHFMEINSRIQVEHRVSEAVSRVRGAPVRLVGEQFRVAAGQKLGYTQKDVSFEGYAIEARINASNPNFLIGASGSVIQSYDLPPTGPDFFYDDGGAAGLFAADRRNEWEVPNFDSNFGLAVFRGASQHEAFERAEKSILEFQIRGNAQLRTTRPFHLGVLSLLRSSAPYGKIRTDFSEIFLAFGAHIYQSLARITPKAGTANDPLRRLLLAGLSAFQTDPGLAIAFAFHEQRLRGDAGNDGADAAPKLLSYLADLIQCRLFPEERGAISALKGKYPPLIDQILSAVAESKVFDFRRGDGDLEFDIPATVSVPRDRKLLIEELRDTAVQNLAPRKLVASELNELRHILQTLQNKMVEHVEGNGLLHGTRVALAACAIRLESASELSPTEFREFCDDLKRVKWTLRKGGVSAEVETVLMTEVNRAFRVVRGPNVVAHLAGTIYLRPSPAKPDYVKPGDEVHEDETVVALLENMKMFNEIRAHMSGTIKEILVENERPVLPGDVIMIIE